MEMYKLTLEERRKATREWRKGMLKFDDIGADETLMEQGGYLVYNEPPFESPQDALSQLGKTLAHLWGSFKINDNETIVNDTCKISGLCHKILVTYGDHLEHHMRWSLDRNLALCGKFWNNHILKDGGK